MFKLTVLVIVVMLSINSFSQQSESSTRSERIKFDPNRDAAKDIEDAINQAKKENKRILLDVGGEWCIWCHRLDELFETNKDISDFLKENYILVKVNYSKENKNETVLSKYPPVDGYPHFFVLDKNGKLIHSQNTGELEADKGHDKQKVFNFLKKYATQKSMDKKSKTH